MSPQDLTNPAGPRLKPRSNVYTMILFLSLLAIGLGILCLYLEMEKYQWDLEGNKSRVRPSVGWLDAPGNHPAHVLQVAGATGGFRVT